MNSKLKSLGAEIVQLPLTIVLGIPFVPISQMINGWNRGDPYSISREAISETPFNGKLIGAYETLLYPFYFGTRGLRKGLGYIFR